MPTGLAVLALGVVCSGVAYLIYFRLIADFGGVSALTVAFLIPVNLTDNAYAYSGVSGEARTGQTLYGGTIGLRMAF